MVIEDGYGVKYEVKDGNGFKMYVKLPNQKEAEDRAEAVKGIEALLKLGSIGYKEEK